MSRALFWVAQQKQKKNDISPDFVEMETFFTYWAEVSDVFQTVFLCIKWS